MENQALLSLLQNVTTLSGDLCCDTALPARIDPAAPPFDLALGEAGRPAEQVLAEVSELLRATPSAASPRFLNQLFGGRDPVAAAAEMMTVLPNTSMYTFKVAGPQVLVEREVLRRMCGAVGFERGEGMLCPGGSLSNLTAMLLARNEAAAGVREHGLDGRRLTVYTSAVGHYSIPKNAGILGLGRGNVRLVPTDGAERMDVDALAAAIERDLADGCLPVMVNATAGTTVAGAFDPLPAIADITGRHGIWLHVDGALGGSVALSPRHRSLLDGVERADSMTWNAHKLMGVPLACSAVLVARPGLLRCHLDETADYLFQADDSALNPGTRSIQCGRRNDALKLWAAWRHHGDAGYAVRIDRLFELAAEAAALIEADPAFELVMPPPSALVCFEVRGVPSAAVCERLDAEGRLKIGHGAVNGRSAIRLPLVNPDLTRADLETTFAEIKIAAAAVAG